MQVPLQMSATKNGVKIWRNGKPEYQDYPFKPFLLLEADKFPHLNSKTAIIEKLTKLPDAKEINYLKLKFDNTREQSDFLKRYSNDLNYIYKNKYLEEIFISHEDYPSRFPNDQPLTLIMYDIETRTIGDKKFPKPSVHPIICMGASIWKLYPDQTKEKIAYFYINDYLEDAYDINDPTKFEMDKKIISSYINLYKEYDPDIIFDYNGTSFDFPYIVERAKLLGIDISPLSRSKIPPKCEIGYNGEMQIQMDGRIHYDIYKKVMKDQSLYGLPNKSMKTVARNYNVPLSIEDDVELKEAIENTESVRINHPDLLERYQLADVIRTEHLAFIYLRNDMTLAEMLKVPLDNIVNGYASFVPKIFTARNMHYRKLVSAQTNFSKYNSITGTVCKFKRCDTKELKFQGAFVGMYKYGWFPYTYKLDFSNMYPSCLDATHEVLTKEGWKNISECTTNDIFITYNDSFETKLQKPKQMLNVDYKGGMYDVENTKVSFRCTANHRIPFYKKTTKAVGGNVVKIGAKHAIYTVQEAKDIGWGSNNRFICSVMDMSGREPTIEEKKYIKLIPWIITEGWSHHRKLYISQRYSVNKAHCDEIEKILIDSGIEYHRSDRSDPNRMDYEWRFKYLDDKVLLRLLPDIKAIPNWINELSYEYRMDFIRALVNADGNTNKSTNNTRVGSVFVQKRKEFMDQLQALCFRCGIAASLSDEYTDERNGNTWYYLHLNDHLQATEISRGNVKNKPDSKLIENEYWEGKVYCPVFGNEFDSFIIRRNGRVSLTKNCIATFNLGPDTTKLIELRPYTGKYKFRRDIGYDWYSIPDANFNCDLVVRVVNDREGMLKTEIKKLWKARADIRSEIKVTIDEYKLPGLNSQQMGIKVILNTIYGLNGEKSTTYGDMITAIMTTALCRFCTTQVIQKYNSILVELDSVTGDTPIWVKNTHTSMYDILPIEDIHTSDSKYVEHSGLYEVLTRNGFSEIEYSKKHEVTKNIHRIRTVSGLVDVTEDHSLFNINQEEIQPKNINIGDKIEVSDFRVSPNIHVSNFSKEEAFVLGFIQNNCKIATYKTRYKTFKFKLILPMRYKHKKSKFISYLNKSLGKKFRVKFSSSIVNNKIEIIPWGHKNKDMFDYIISTLYTHSGYDKVPMYVLQNVKEYGESFVGGLSSHFEYEHMPLNKRKQISLITYSKTLAAGVYYIWRHQCNSIYVNELESGEIKVIRRDRNNISDIEIVTSNKKLNLGKINVYDISTKDGTFVTALGDYVLHNTDGLAIDRPVDKDENNKYLDQMIMENFNISENYMKMDLDDVGPAYFCSMKNYVVQEQGKYNIHGSSLKSSRMCKLQLKVRDLAIEHWFNSKPVEEVIYEAYNYKNYQIEDFMLNVRLAKDLSEYDDKEGQTGFLAAQYEHVKGIPATSGTTLNYVISNKTLSDPKFAKFYKKKSGENYILMDLVKDVSEINKKFYDTCIDKMLIKFNISKIKQQSFLGNIGMQELPPNVKLDKVPMDDIMVRVKK